MADLLDGIIEVLTRARTARSGIRAVVTAPHVTAGSIVDLPDPLTEMLLISPVAETSRRWLNDPEIDLTKAAKFLPDRIWAALTNH